jgi:S-adenosylmethionine hydrolase
VTTVRPFVTFLSDFGATDQFAGICHGIVNRVCPEATVIHLTHGIRPQAVGEGARVLARSVPYLPVGVHMAVVDPGVGSERRAVALRTTDGRLFVGPDNGLLVPAAEACGGVELAVEIAERRFMLGEVSHTFHGRDIFSPVAGHLAGGLDPRELGPQVDPAQLVRCQMDGFQLDGTRLTAAVQHVDRFGNIELSVSFADLGTLFQAGRQVEIEADEDRYYAVCAETFADVGAGELVLYEDSDRSLSLAINRGRAAELLDVPVGELLHLEFAPAAG